MNIENINNINGIYGLGNSTIIESASKEVLDSLKGVQYIKAKAILEKAIELLNTGAKVS